MLYKAGLMGRGAARPGPGEGAFPSSFPSPRKRGDRVSQGPGACLGWGREFWGNGGKVGEERWRRDAEILEA